jgi:hypothetical protein
MYLPRFHWATKESQREGRKTELKRVEDMLVQYVEDIQAGKSSIDDCLERYPCLREQLEPLLKIALEIRDRRDNGIGKV